MHDALGPVGSYLGLEDAGGSTGYHFSLRSGDTNRGNRLGFVERQLLILPRVATAPSDADDGRAADRFDRVEVAVLTHDVHPVGGGHRRDPEIVDLRASAFLG